MLFLKKFFSYLWRYKKTFLYLCILIVLFWSLRFPWNNFLSLFVQEKTANLSQNVQFEDLKLKIFPPGVQFNKVSLIYNRKKLDWDSLSVYLDWLKWLALKKAFNVELKKDNSHLLLNFYKKNQVAGPEEEQQELYFIRTQSPQFSLDLLSSLLNNIPLKGDLSFRAFFEGSPADVENIKASLKLSSGAIGLSPYQWNSTLGPVSFPAMTWKKVSADVQLKEGELLFNKIELGSPGDAIQIKARGSGAWALSYGQFRLNAYNIELEMDLKKDFRFGFLDIMFGAFKEDNDKFYRYRLRLIGEGDKVPTMEKLETF